MVFEKFFGAHIEPYTLGRVKLKLATALKNGNLKNRMIKGNRVIKEE